MSIDDGWPSVPAVESNDPRLEFKKLLYEAQLRVFVDAKLRSCDQQAASSTDASTRELEEMKAAWADDGAHQLAVHNAYLDVAKGQIDRAMDRAEFVQKAAGAIGAAYVAILGLSFGVSEGSDPLPLRGGAPTVFLAMSIVMSTGYLSYLTHPGTTPPPKLTISNVENNRIRRNAFINWTHQAVLRRRYLLQASVWSLAFSLLFLPVAYLKIDDWVVALLVLIAILITFVAPEQFWTVVREERQSRRSSDASS